MPGKRRLTDDDIITIRMKAAEGITHGAQAREYKVTSTYIGMIVRGEVRPELGFVRDPYEPARTPEQEAALDAEADASLQRLLKMINESPKTKAKDALTRFTKPSERAISYGARTPPGEEKADDIRNEDDLP